MTESRSLSRRGRLLTWAGLCLALATGSTLMAGSFGGPWARLPWLGRNGARYSIIARNYDRIGFLATGLAPVASTGDPAIAPRRYYLHHPPLLPLTLGFVARLFGGLPEDAARAVAALFSALNIALLFWLGWLLGGRLAAVVVALVAAVAPMTSVYGAHVDVQGPQVLSFILLAWILLRHDADRPSRRIRLLALGACGLGMFSDWPAFYLCLVAPVVWRLDRRPGVRRLALWMGLLAAVIVLVLKGQAALVGEAGGGLGESLEVRSLSFFRAMFDRPAEVGAALLRWLRTQGELFPWPLLLACVAALWRGAPRAARAWGAGLAAVGLIHVALFPAGAMIHDYWTFAVQPGFVLLGGLGLARLFSARRASGLLATAGRVAGALLAVVFVWLSLAAWQGRLEPKMRDMRHVLLGEQVAVHTTPRSIILTNAPYNPLDGQWLTYPQFGYYADRWVTGGITSPEALRHARGSIPATLFLLVPASAFPESLDAGATAALKANLAVGGAGVEIAPGAYLFPLAGG